MRFETIFTYFFLYWFNYLRILMMVKKCHLQNVLITMNDYTNLSIVLITGSVLTGQK
jgi:hypothetical protein